MIHFALTYPFKCGSPFKKVFSFRLLVLFGAIRSRSHLQDLEWKVVYVGSAESEAFDQELDCVMVGPVSMGENRFVLEVWLSLWAVLLKKYDVAILLHFVYHRWPDKILFLVFTLQTHACSASSVRFCCYKNPSILAVTMTLSRRQLQIHFASRRTSSLE